MVFPTHLKSKLPDTVSDESLMKQLPLSLSQGVSEGAMAALVPQDDAYRAL